MSEIIQTLYSHGGSRIYSHADDGSRTLLLDTYHTKEFAKAAMAFVVQWESGVSTETLNTIITQGAASILKLRSFDETDPLDEKLRVVACKMIDDCKAAQETEQ